MDAQVPFDDSQVYASAYAFRGYLVPKPKSAFTGIIRDLRTSTLEPIRCGGCGTKLAVVEHLKASAYVGVVTIAWDGAELLGEDAMDGRRHLPFLTQLLKYDHRNIRCMFLLGLRILRIIHCHAQEKV